MKTRKLLICCLLAISTTNSFGAEINQEKETNIVKNADNPFYPKYLNENIQHAVNAIVDMKLREDRKKLAELQRKEKERLEKERLTKQQRKAKRGYTKIPNTINAKSLIKNNTGGYEIVTKSGTTLKKGSRVYNGTVVAITHSFIYLDRKEKGKIKHHKIKYSITF